MRETVTAEKLVASRLTDAVTAAKVAPGLDAACEKFGILEPRHVAAFVSQCAVESCGFRATSENLNYSAGTLLKVFGKYFTAALAAEYASKPNKAEAIANRVYAREKLGNGPESSGDGWKYRGRGFIQVTGKANYALLSKAVGVDFVANPDLVATPEYAAMSAAWYWSSHKLNVLADTPGVEDETKVINGGTLGLKERQENFDRADPVFEKEG